MYHIWKTAMCLVGKKPVKSFKDVLVKICLDRIFYGYVLGHIMCVSVSNTPSVF